MVVLSFCPREELDYQSCYCEENIYRLCMRIGHLSDDDVKLRNNFTSTDLPGELGRFSVAFISNPRKAVPLFSQRSSGDRPYVIWDYHVILLERLTTGSYQVWDFDTTLPFPCPFDRYFQETFHPDLEIDSRLKRYIRVISSPSFLALFSSDRSHMISEDGSWSSPPPPWPAIFHQPTGNNISHFMDMRHNDVTDTVSTVYPEEQFRQTFTSSQA